LQFGATDYKGDFDVNDLIGFSGNSIVQSRYEPCFGDFFFRSKENTWKQITNVNTATYDSLALSKTERRYVTTTDGKKMLVWVILPPILMLQKISALYCQGGPQRPDTILFFPLEFSVTLGYIVVAPNRRGMPGHGWNGMSKLVKTGADR
jgi:dipeptidyl aminopeptidase/acylaminoacyl peptidase